MGRQDLDKIAGLGRQTDEYLYKNVSPRFYDRQLHSINPVRRWFHANRYYIINNLVQGKIYSAKSRIIDLGSGSCDWNINGANVYGVDLNEELLKLAKSKNMLVDYTASDIFKAELENESFDIVVASELLEHLPYPGDAVSLIMKLLRPAGFAVISVPYDTFFSLWRYLFFIQVFLRGYLLNDKYYRKCCGHLHRFSPRLIKELFLDKGFEVDLIFGMRKLTIFLVVRKKGVLEYRGHDYSDLTIICPTLNEARNIGQLLMSILSAYKDAKIIVSDDGSSDGTAMFVKELNNPNVFFLDRKDMVVHGLCVSVLDAIQLVKTKYFIVLDADGQHPADKIHDIVNALRLGRKLVVASRVGVNGSWPLRRKLVSYLGTFLGKGIFLLRGNPYFSYDILSGFFGAERSFWDESVYLNNQFRRFRLKGYKVLFDFLKSMPRNVDFAEVYYKFGARENGGSKINYRVCWEYIKSVFS